jgi:peptide/nickel transport system substrate-binding protein
MRRVTACALALACLAVSPGQAQAQTSGGELVFPVSAEPASYDGHREEAAGLIDAIAPFYNTLLRVDPSDPGGTKPYPSIAESWTVADDGRTYTFKIRGGVRFHDGSTLTSQDVKASYDRIIFRSEGAGSRRDERYAVVEAVEAPDGSTLVFRLKRPSASFIASLLAPHNFIYKAEILARDPRWYEWNVMGTGPFTLVEHVAGSHLRGRKNPDYWDRGKPYLDGFRAVFIRRPAAQVAAVRSGRAHILFRGVTPTDREALKAALGDAIEVQESPWNCVLLLSINHEKKPFDDRRVRRALTLALDRHQASRALSEVAIVKSVAGVQVPDTPYAAPPAALNALAGYWTDIGKSRAEARRLLDEAGVPEGYTFTFRNRGIPMPYEPLGIWLIDQWRRIGLNANLDVSEPAGYLGALRKGEHEVAMDLHCGEIVEPSFDLKKFLSADRNPANTAGYTDRVLDALYDRQSRATDLAERRKLVRAFERRLLDEEAHVLATLQWQRIVPHSSRLKGWQVTPSPSLNRTLDGVWLER